MTSRYWEEREQANKRRYNRADKEAQKEVREIHKRMQDEIQKDIDAFFGKYAAEEGITLAEAKRRVSKLDIEAFERKAKKYVEDRDFSEQANAEMKLYNLTMKVNRLELLKAEIGLEMIKAHDEINGLTDRVLLERAEEEYRRQAGILGDTVQDIAGRARRLADASFHNATWKDRAWTNHAELKANLDVLLQRGLIRGDNPRQLARSLRKSLGVDLNKCERLMVTELARVQIDASIDSFKQNGFEQYRYITCGYGDACENCKALSDKIFKIKDMQVGENAPPMHPWCHCSIAPYEDSEEYDAWLDFLDQGGTTAEWDAFGKADWKNDVENNKISGYNRSRNRNKLKAIPFKDYSEPMTKKHIRRVMKEMGVDFGKARITIDYQEEYIGTGLFGYTNPNGKEIIFYPDAFMSREELVKTIGHEKVHHRQIQIYGPTNDTDVGLGFEEEARESEEKWWADYQERISRA